MICFDIKKSAVQTWVDRQKSTKVLQYRSRLLRGSRYILLTALLSLLKSVDARSFGHIKSHSYWLAKYGKPKQFSIATWCDGRGVTLAIPRSHQEKDLLVSAAWGSPLSGQQVQVRSSSKKADCVSRFVSDFFILNDTSYDAWLARATHENCQGHSVETRDSFIYNNRFTLTFRTPEDQERTRAVLTSCACLKGSNDEPPVCHASSRWQHLALDTVDGPQKGTTLVGGYTLNSAALVGPQSNIEVLPDDER
eukprot:Blabericola_migrator_1__110@NODE_1028_length_5664_cov_44_189566_g708_i0_p4_GENE_NODE_1028_length_5664_cov_44_189566_g708_i0NODE_1028_length_5664_cov_44_189566_g708_i0_p4_ORF_typecomplete_len251_score16_31_NODE_1028_length_5664_cov_44_189566_g708_i014812233